MRRHRLLLMAWLVALGGPPTLGAHEEDAPAGAGADQPIDITPKTWGEYEVLGPKSYAEHFDVSIERSFAERALMDVARVNVVDAQWDQAPMNSVFRRSSPELSANLPNFAITFRNSEPGMFDWICRSGATTGERCGTAVGFSANAGQIYKVRVEDAKACHGDSGGPWYSLGRSAYGIHESSQQSTSTCSSESESEDSYAYTIRRAEEYAGATVITSGSRSPFGHLDGASRVPGYIRVQGWTVDPDVLSPIGVHIYVDATGYDIGPATVNRPDVDAVYPLYDADVGFDAYVAVGPGPNNVCAYAINLDLGSHVGLNCIHVP